MRDKLKDKIRTILIVFLLTVFTFLIFCKQQKSKWQGTIEEVDGVTIVKNPKEPIYTADVLNFEEELSIPGPEGKDEPMFSQIRGIAVDEEERIYILDIKEGHIKVFDRLGNYLNTIGKKGQGPGEMQYPAFISITPRNEIVIEDPAVRRLTFYSLEGEYLKNISTAGGLMVDMKIDSLGNVIGTMVVREEENPRYELVKCDSELNKLFTIGTSPLPKPGKYNPFIPVMVWALADNDRIVFGYPKEYEIKILDAEGNAEMRISQNYDPVAVAEEEIKEIEKERKGSPDNRELDVPSHHPAYRWIIVDDVNRLWVRTWEKPSIGEGFYYDVFDTELKYIAKVPLKQTPLVFMKGKLFTIEEDEEGFQVVKRHKINWRI
jgi:hypothetical protein